MKTFKALNINPYPAGTESDFLCHQGSLTNIKSSVLHIPKNANGPVDPKMEKSI